MQPVSQRNLAIAHLFHFRCCWPEARDVLEQLWFAVVNQQGALSWTICQSHAPGVGGGWSGSGLANGKCGRLAGCDRLRRPPVGLPSHYYISGNWNITNSNGHWWKWYYFGTFRLQVTDRYVGKLPSYINILLSKSIVKRQIRCVCVMEPCAA